MDDRSFPGSDNNLISLGRIASTSIRQECSAKKLGNVHPLASFSDMTYQTFLDASVAIEEAVDGCLEDFLPQGSLPSSTPSLVGPLALACVQSMQAAVPVNTSLGTILLFAPLLSAATLKTSDPAEPTPAIQPPQSSRSGAQPGSPTGSQKVRFVLAQMNELDSQMVYQAIALCAPGGLGDTDKMSVHGAAPPDLLTAMSYAAEFDDIALQFVTDFELVFHIAGRIIDLSQHFAQYPSQQSSHLAAHQNAPEVKCFATNEAVSVVQLELLAIRPDSLIARKTSREFACEVQRRARSLLDELQRDGSSTCSVTQHVEWIALDRWMREQRSPSGRQLANPGTHADLIAAALLVTNLRRHQLL